MENPPGKNCALCQSKIHESNENEIFILHHFLSEYQKFLY